MPMIGMVWKLARFLDDRIHVQQAAGASSVGYVPFYTYKNYQIFGNEKFSGSKADREYWTHDTLDIEKDILKMRAHQKLVQQTTGRVPKGHGAGNAAHDNHFLLLPSSSKTKRNRKNRLAYNQRRKAKAAQQSAASKPATTTAPAPAPAVKKSNP